ncbi:MAG: hypothetical protein U0802_17920 [Candidatus Binatia bacterium]
MAWQRRRRRRASTGDAAVHHRRGVAQAGGQLARLDGGADAVADARLIREQVERCREILLQMAADAGESTGEPLVPAQAGAIVRQALSGLPDPAHRRARRASTRPC